MLFHGTLIRKSAEREREREREREGEAALA
jgi:hypothetical protein